MESPSPVLPAKESKVLDLYDDSKDNRRLSSRSIESVFRKTGPYIVNMGAVNFFEYLVVNLLVSVQVSIHQQNLLMT
jgi:hypothetical protein